MILEASIALLLDKRILWRHVALPAIVAVEIVRLALWGILGSLLLLAGPVVVVLHLLKVVDKGALEALSILVVRLVILHANQLHVPLWNNVVDALLQVLLRLLHWLLPTHALGLLLKDRARLTVPSIFLWAGPLVVKSHCCRYKIDGVLCGPLAEGVGGRDLHGLHQ